MNVRTLAGLLAVAAMAGSAGYLVRGDGGAGSGVAAPEAAASARVPNQLQFAEGAPQLSAVRTLVEEELNARQFMPEIERIVAVTSYATPCTWSVVTVSALFSSSANSRIWRSFSPWDFSDQ